MATGSDVSHVTRSNVITGSDAFFPLTIVVVQHVPLEVWVQGYILYYYSKKNRVTSGYDVF